MRTEAKIERQESFLTLNMWGKNMTPVHKELLQELQDFARTASTAQSVMERIANRVHEKMTRYNWVGFYLVDPTDAGFLLVGPFVGSFTPHARIPLNNGLCGAAASSAGSLSAGSKPGEPDITVGAIPAVDLVGPAL